MARPPPPPPLPPSPPALVLLVQSHLESAGPRGLSKAELLAAITRKRDAAASIQPLLCELRDVHDAPPRYDGRTRRWVLDAPRLLRSTRPIAKTSWLC